MELILFNKDTKQLEDLELDYRTEILSDFYKIIGCDLVEIAPITEDIDLYVDETGLMKNPETLNIVEVDDYQHVLFGNMIFASYDESGKMKGLNAEQKAFIKEQVSIKEVSNPYLFI